MKKRDGSVNLAIGKAALQSSYIQYSNIDDPVRAISGKITGSYSFHTDLERDPWWFLDLGQTCKIENIIIYNRGDGAQSRARYFSIDIFSPSVGGWNKVYRAENEFGGYWDGHPLRLNFGAKGKLGRYLKFAVEGYNFLHLDQIEVFGIPLQQDYEDALKQIVLEQSSVIGFRDRPVAEEAALGAIVGLVRGYDQIENYDALIARNQAIYESINRQRNTHYPLLIWHEGNITKEQQEYILAREKNKEVKFIDISERFRLPTSLNADDMEESWPIGYRLMCKFNCTDIWDLTQSFKYILRVDEDCILSNIIEDPFEWMAKHDLDCAFSWLIDDNHELTNETFPCFVEAYLSINAIHPEGKTPVTSCFPYTNVMMGRGEFFRSKNVWNFLSQTTAEQDFYTKRWGDHIVLGVCLNLFSSFAKIQPIVNLEYAHHSHSVTVRANDDHRVMIMERMKDYDPSKLNGLSADKYQTSLLGLFVEWPLNLDLRRQLIQSLEDSGQSVIAKRIRDCSTLRYSVVNYDELVRLYRENKQLQMERNSLLKAVAWSRDRLS